MSSSLSGAGPLRCSLWARTQGLDPAGTAGDYDGFLLLDLPLPWPRDVSEIEEVAALADQLRGRRLRVQATVPEGPTRRAVLFSRAAGDGWFSGLEGRTTTIVDGDVGSAAAALLAGDGAAVDGTDLLVCGHGRRDVCCGSWGTDLAMELARDSRLGDSRLGGTRLHRTSHTGGHRFAPTFIVLPEATMWAFADADLVDRVLLRRGDSADVADRYRGCACVGSPRIQALEREVLRDVGWELLSLPRRGSEAPGTNEVRLEVRMGDGRVAVWEAAVTPGRTLPVPDCGRPIEEAKKSETEWVVEGLSQLPAA